MRELAGLVSGLELLLARAGSVLDESELAEAVAVARRVTARRGFLGDTFVMALVGGTGAGKSSLLNAIAGEHVSSVSAIRPHTDAPMAWVPEEPDSELSDFLADLGIVAKATNSALPGLALLDLPDQDSVVRRHRRAVWEVLPRADAIAWVVDPDKYHDRGLHGDYISVLAEYQDQALFVLNKVDLLGKADRLEVELDFIATLQSSGVARPRVFLVAADPPAGPQIGIERVAKHLRRRMDSKTMLNGKTLSDIRWAVGTIGRRSGLGGGGAISYDDRWTTARDGLAAALASGAGFEDTLCRLEDFVAGVSVQAGGTFGRKVLADFPPERLEAEVRRVFEAQVGSNAGHPFRRLRTAQEANAESGARLAEELDARIGRPLGKRFWDRAFLAATLASVAVDAEQAQAKLRK